MGVRVSCGPLQKLPTSAIFAFYSRFIRFVCVTSVQQVWDGSLDFNYAKSTTRNGNCNKHTLKKWSKFYNTPVVWQSTQSHREKKLRYPLMSQALRIACQISRDKTKKMARSLRSDCIFTFIPHMIMHYPEMNPNHITILKDERSKKTNWVTPSDEHFQSQYSWSMNCKMTLS